MVRLSCTAQGCNTGEEGSPFKTDDVADAVALELLKMHREDCHSQARSGNSMQQSSRMATPRGKIDMPKLAAHCTSEQWDDFIYDWHNYKAAMGIDGQVSSAYLYGCLEEELRRDLRKSNPTVQASDMLEENLLKAVKDLTVKSESVLARRIKLGKATQAPGQSIRTFYAQLKGLASAGGYKVSFKCKCETVNEVDYSTAIIQDQLIRGIADQEILADLLGDEKIDRSLEQIVEYIARKEQAKLEQGVVTTNHSNNAALQSKSERICRQCQGKDHGRKTRRLQECPARDHVCEKCKVKGHFSKACLKCKDCSEWGHGSKRSQKCNLNKSDKNKNNSEVESMVISALGSTFVGGSMEGVSSMVFV